MSWAVGTFQAPGNQTVQDIPGLRPGRCCQATVPGSEASIAGWGPSPWRPRDQSRNLAFSGNRPALRCKRDMQTWRQGGWGEALLGEATAIQKVVIPDQGATSESSF